MISQGGVGHRGALKTHRRGYGAGWRGLLSAIDRAHLLHALRSDAIQLLARDANASDADLDSLNFLGADPAPDGALADTKLRGKQLDGIDATALGRKGYRALAMPVMRHGKHCPVLAVQKRTRWNNCSEIQLIRPEFLYRFRKLAKRSEFRMLVPLHGPIYSLPRDIAS